MKLWAHTRLLILVVGSASSVLQAQEITEFPLPGGPSIFGSTDGFVYTGTGRISTSTDVVYGFPPGASCSPLLPNPYNVPLGVGLDGNLWYSWVCPGDYLLHIPYAHFIGRMTTGGVTLPASVAAPVPRNGVVGPDGYLWCTGQGIGLARIGTDLRVVTFSPPNLAELGPTVGVTTDSASNVWFTYSLGAIGKKAPAADPVLFYQFAAGHQLGDIATGPDGSLWFVEEANGLSGIGRISPGGVVTEFPAPRVNVTLSGITGGPDGNVWFTEPESSTVAQITPTGVITEYTTPSAGSMPEAITAGPDGNIWFVETGVGKTARLTVNPNACRPAPTSLCLDGGRFRVDVQWQRANDATSSAASAVALTSNTGYFWFFDSGNVELVTKVLDACSTNNHYWFFAGGLTNVGVQIKVKDTISGLERNYSSAIGTPLAAVQDTTAFSTCP